MNALFTVEKCPEPVTKELRKVKEEDLDHDYVFDIQQSPIKKPQVQPRSGGGPSLQVLNHYIAAEEVTWNYAPHLKPTDR